MKTDFFGNAIQGFSSIFASKQSKMAKELDNFVESLNDRFIQYRNHTHLLSDLKFNAKQFEEENAEVNFSMNNRKNMYNLSHWWIIILVVFCILADFWIMREVSGQFSISDPNLGIVLGFMLLTIELTLAALAFKQSGTKDKFYLMNQIGKFLFLLFIPSMAFLSYKQNQSNIILGGSGISMEIVELKMIFISVFSLLIHFLLVFNLEKGFKAYYDMKTIKRYKKIQKEIEREYGIMKKITEQIQSMGGTYLRELNRYNRLYPQFAKQLEYLPNGVISLVNEGQDEDVINLKPVKLTQIKTGYSREEIFRLKLNKSSEDQYNKYLGETNQPIIQSHEETFVKNRSTKKTTKEMIEDQQSELPESYESFFGSKEKAI